MESLTDNLTAISVWQGQSVGFRFGCYVQEPARNGTSMHDVEQKIHETFLQIGHAPMKLLIDLQPDGDLGPTVETSGGVTLHAMDPAGSSSHAARPQYPSLEQPTEFYKQRILNEQKSLYPTLIG